MDWLLASIDASRPHVITGAVSWHARVMVMAWGILAPLAVLVARYLKVLPGQDWPRELDSHVWWRSHWIGQSVVFALTLFGFALIYRSAAGGTWHGLLGYVVIAFVSAQVLMGLFRGSKGGPTDRTMRGDHYDMTPWRIAFEWLHKITGYTLLAVSAVTIVSGLWLANAPRWMWLVIGFWWLALGLLAGMLQRRGMAFDTYQAIWGPSPDHPGNRRAGMCWGMRRHEEDQQPGE